MPTPNMKAWSTISTTLALAGTLAATPPQETATPSLPAASPGERADELEGRRERWLQKSPAERARLRGLFEELRALSPEEREILRERARLLRELEAGERSGAAPEIREQAALLRGTDEERFWRERTHDRVREQGRRLREELPAPLLDELRGAPPEARPLLVERWMRAHPDQHERVVLLRLTGELGLPRGEVDRLLALPPHERRPQVAHLRRRLAERRGKPRFLTDGEWQALRGIPDDQRFVDELRRRELPRRGEGFPRRGPEAGGSPPAGGLRPQAPPPNGDPSRPPPRSQRDARGATTLPPPAWVLDPGRPHEAPQTRPEPPAQGTPPAPPPPESRELRDTSSS
jgi:hypothetical protein